MGTISDKLYDLKNGVSVVIRTARESDAEAYLSLGKSIMSEEIYSLTQADELDFSSGHRKRNSHTGDFGMGVHKDFRGLGIGTLLLKALIEWAKNNTQIEKINLCVHQTNDRAIATYKKIGFEIEGVRSKDLKYPNGVYVNTVLMGLHL